MHHEFGAMDSFDPAQFNLLILQSGLTYQYLMELEAQKIGEPLTAFGYLAEQSIQRKYGKKGVRNLPVFPFTASFLSPDDGLILTLDRPDDSVAYHQAELVKEKVHQ